jgi:hypothetical protein
MAKLGLTVAIPTMDRWDSFLSLQLPKYLNNPLIDCVVVSDENGHDIESICEAGYSENPKLRLYQNPGVLGVYGNKRQCFLRSPTEWVAVLDSDNSFEANFFEDFLVCVGRDLDEAKNTIYCAGKNVRLDIKTGLIEDRTAHFSGIRISRDNWNTVLNTRGWNFLLNDGNCIWPKAVVKHLPDLPEDQIVGTDSIYAMRQAILGGYTLSVEPTMSYVHTVHDRSHWLLNSAESSRLLATRNWRV